MSNCWSRHFLFLLVAGLALAAPGCSCGDDDGTGDRPDARETADSAPEIDAGDEGGLLRGGTIAITEARLTNNVGIPVNGALVRVGFSDATTGNPPPPVPGFTSPVGGCLVQVWDVGTHEPSDPADEGPLQVTGGTANGDFACAFVEAANQYMCQSTDAAIAGGSAEDFTLSGDGTPTGGVFTFVGGGGAPEMAGTFIRVSGFAGVPDGTMFPVLAHNANGVEDDTLTLAGVPDTDGDLTGGAAATYSTFVGVGPVPGGFNFLAGAADEFTAAKAAGEVVGVIDEDFGAHGQGFTLDATNPDMDIFEPHTVPFESTDVTFSCTGDACGVDGTGGILGPAMIINGQTTDVADLDPITPGTIATAMPPAETQYATFQCAFFDVDEATLPAAAMDAILGTNPTRMQISLGRFRGSALADADATYQIFMVQGHSVMGFSDAPPPE